MPEIKIRPIPLPKRGLEYRKAGWELEPGWSPNAQNFWIYRSIGKKRTGQVNYGSGIPFTGEEVGAIIEFETFAGDNFLLAISTGDAYKYDKTTDAWGSLSGSLSGDIDYPVSFTEMNNLLIFTNFIDNIKKWTGNGNVADLANATNYKAKIVRQFYNHLMLLNVTETGTAVPQRVRWSDVGDPEDWTTGDAGSNDLVDFPGWIMGGELLGNHLVIYKEDSIVLCDWTGGTSIFSFVTKVSGTGIYCQNSLVNVKDRHFFLGNDNVYSYDGSNIVYPIGNSIKHELFGTLNAPYKDRIFAFKLDQYYQYWLGVPTTTAYPDTFWVYNWEDKSWFKFKLAASAGGLWKAQATTCWDGIDAAWDDLSQTWDDKIFSEVFSALFLGTYDGYVRRYNYLSTNDAGVKIDGYFETPDYTIKEEKTDRPLMGRWLGVKFYGKGDAVTIDYSTDQGSTWTNAGTQTLTSSWVEYTQKFDVTSNRCRVRFRNNTLSQTFQIQSKYDLEYQEKAQ